MNQAELIKSIDEFINDTLNKSENKFDDVSDNQASGTDVSLPANGGKDVIKNKEASKTNLEDAEKAKSCKKGDDEDEDDKDKDEDMKSKKSMDASEDQTEEKLVKSEEKDQKVEETPNKFEVSKEDFDFLQKAKSDVEEQRKKEEQENDPLFKSISGVFDLVKQLSEDVAELKKQPARDPKAIRGAQAIEKSQAPEKPKKFRKSQVLAVMDQLKKSNQITTDAIIEYESTGSISNPQARAAVSNALQEKGLN